MMPLVLAHGALGWWDEIIFLGVIIVFLAIMGYSWVKSRSATLDADPPPSQPAQPASGNHAPEDRFTLE
ncbi:MAG: hypothetical protein SNJ59_03530 [Aggregatilineales bacterium]